MLGSSLSFWTDALRYEVIRTDTTHIKCPIQTAHQSGHVESRKSFTFLQRLNRRKGQPGSILGIEHVVEQNLR